MNNIAPPPYIPAQQQQQQQQPPPPSFYNNNNNSNMIISSVPLPRIQLVNTRDERRRMDTLGDIYGLLIVCEHLETAYIRGSISDKAYTKQCKKLLAQYKTLAEQETIPDLDLFSEEYSIDCKAAINRFKLRIPATQLHGSNSDDSKGKELDVFHAVQNFITTMDSLKLEMRAVDELHPSVSDLMDSLNKLSHLPPEHESKLKVQKWLIKLSNMKANDELDEEQARQMSFDLDQSYNAFHKFIQENAGKGGK